MTIKVIADDEACLASRQCSAVAPRIFDNDEVGIVLVRGESFPDDELEGAEYAARICPASAIWVQRQS